MNIKYLSRELHNQRLQELITLDQFVNEMQTTYPRHIVQEFMYYSEKHNSKEIYRYAWLETFTYWRHIENVVATKMLVDIDKEIGLATK